MSEFSSLIEKWVPVSERGEPLPHSLSEKGMEALLKGVRFAMYGDNYPDVSMIGRTRDRMEIGMSVTDASDFLAGPGYRADIGNARRIGDEWELDLGRFRKLRKDRVTFENHELEVDSIDLVRGRERVTLFWDTQTRQWESYD